VISGPYFDFSIFFCWSGLGLHPVQVLVLGFRSLSDRLVHGLVLFASLYSGDAAPEQFSYRRFVSKFTFRCCGLVAPNWLRFLLKGVQALTFLLSVLIPLSGFISCPETGISVCAGRVLVPRYKDLVLPLVFLRSLFLPSICVAQALRCHQSGPWPHNFLQRATWLFPAPAPRCSVTSRFSFSLLAAVRFADLVFPAHGSSAAGRSRLQPPPRLRSCAQSILDPSWRAAIFRLGVKTFFFCFLSNT
jgi:hypothetical protein